MADAAEATPRRIGQEGSRWYNAPPTGEELAAWFEKNVQLAEGLQADHYVQGVTLIPGTEKAQSVVGWTGDGKPVIERVENLVFTPYAKVETRIKYFHDLMAANADKWLGVIEPVVIEKQDPRLPPGFFAFVVQTGADTVVRYICCSMKVTVFERETVKLNERLNPRTGEMERWREGKTVIDGAPATKMISTLDRYNKPDSFALMKAETGAIGRALGMAGMLVIPGTGVATAEDMQEASSLDGRPPAGVTDGEQADLPPTDGVAEKSDEKAELTDLRQQAVLLVNTIKEEFPDVFKAFLEWASGRKIGEIGKVEDIRILRGIITKAERELVEAREAKAAAANAKPAT